MKINLIKNTGRLALFIILIVLSILSISMIVTWLAGLSKYEGMTAEEWADEYYAEAETADQLRAEQIDLSPDEQDLLSCLRKNKNFHTQITHTIREKMENGELTKQQIINAAITSSDIEQQGEHECLMQY